MKQKLTAFLLCLVMALSLCAVLPFGSLAEEGANAGIWDGSSTEAITQGEGTAEAPYVISNAAQLAHWSANAETYASAYITLGVDIDLAGKKWTPISTFAGVFDGGDHTIYNLTNTTTDGTIAFFAKASGTIQNVNFENASIPNYSWAGEHAVLVAHAAGELLVQDVHVFNSTLGGCNAGFMVAHTKNNAVTIKDSSVIGGILRGGHKNGQMGGFVANAGDKSLIVENCISVVSTEGALGTRVGGFVGGGGTGAHSFIDCIVVADLSSTTHYVGGFYAVSSTAGGSRNFENCTAYVNLKNESSDIGAFYGSFGGYGGVKLTAKDCVAYGTVHSQLGVASGFVGSKAKNAALSIENIVTYVSAVSDATLEGALIGNYEGSMTIQTSYALMEKVVGNSTSSYNCQSLASVTSLPATLSSEKWEIGAMLEIADISAVPSGNDISIEVYAKAGIVLTAHAGKLFFDGAATDAQGEKVTVDIDGTNVDCVKFLAPGNFTFDNLNDEHTYSLISADYVQKTVEIAACLVGTNTVVFLNKDGTEIDRQLVANGSAATAPPTPTLGYFTFVGWDTAFNNVESDLTVTAIYTGYSGGTGTETDPFLLSSKADLLTFAGDMADATIVAAYASACYKLTEDVDLAGAEWSPIKTFSGIFDGGDHVISNMTNKTNGGTVGFFAYAQGTIQNLTFKNANIPNTQSGGGVHAILVAELKGELTVKNVQILDCTLNGCIKAFLIGKSNGKPVTIKDTTVVSTLVGGADRNGTSAGFIASAGASKVLLENCICIVSATKALGPAGGYVGVSSGGTITFNNCLLIANLTSTTYALGGFCSSTSANDTLKFNGCTAYVTLKGDSYVGAFCGQLGGYNGPSINITDSVAYGTVTTTTGNAGGIAGGITGNHTSKLNVTNFITFVTATATDTGNAGELVGKISVSTTHKILNTYAQSTTFFGSDLSGCTNAIDCKVITSATTLPEGFSTDLWAVGGIAQISGISVTLGNSISVNVYAKLGIVLKAHAGKLYVDGQYVTEGENTVVDGVEYVKFIYENFELADMDEALALSLVGAEATQTSYAITTYLANTYKDYADDANLVALVEAIAFYGNAAQLAAEQEPTAYATFAAAAGIEIPEDFSFEAYIASMFENIDFKTNNTSSVAAGMGIDLSGAIVPVFQVAEGVTTVAVEIYGETTIVDVVDGYAAFYGLNATSLNNTMQVTFYAGDEVVSSQRMSVACYIETALATEGLLSDGEAVLAQALAVYMRAARDYMGLN